jgi:hypothetical protein
VAKGINPLEPEERGEEHHFLEWEAEATEGGRGILVS